MRLSTYKNTIKFIAFFLIFAILLSKVSFIFEKKDSVVKRGKFYKTEQNIDVLLLGSSVMVTGISPMELWNEFGIASYNYAGHAEQLAGNYWNLVNALKYTTPKLVVIDIYNIASDFKVYEDDLSYLHMSIDAMPFSLTKIRAVNDLVPEGEDKLEYLFDFALYHSRWSELSMSDMNVKYSASNGAERKVSSVYADDFVALPNDEYIEYDCIAVRYLERIISLCQENDIDCLLVQLPYAASEDDQKKRNYASKIAEKYNIQYLNMLHGENNMPVIHMSTDLCDGTFHMNTSGSIKSSYYLGEYIKDNYDIPDRRADENYTSWDDDYLYYRANVEFQELKGYSQDIYTFLLLLYDRNIDYHMRINNDQIVLDNKELLPLLENLGIDYDDKGAGAPKNIISNKLEVVQINKKPDDLTGQYDIEITCYDCDNGSLICHVGLWYIDGKFVSELL